MLNYGILFDKKYSAYPFFRMSFFLWQLFMHLKWKHQTCMFSQRHSICCHPRLESTKQWLRGAHRTWSLYNWMRIESYCTDKIMKISHNLLWKYEELLFFNDFLVYVPTRPHSAQQVIIFERKSKFATYNSPFLIRKIARRVGGYI